MSLATDVRELALANNLNCVGIAPASRLQNEAEGLGPNDFLPGARSVVVMGVRLSMGAQLSNKMAYQRFRHSIYSYMWHGFGLINLHFLDRTALLVTRLLEKSGYVAMPVQSSSPVDIRASVSGFSNMHAAVAAGLGELGWSGFALTPDVGPRARFVSVITTAELEPSPLYSGPRLCDPQKCRQLGEGQPVCVKVCPVAALSATEALQTVIGGRACEEAQLQPIRCMWGSLGLSQGSLARNPAPVPDNVQLSDIATALSKLDHYSKHEIGVIYRGDYCGKCIMECPAGSPRAVDEIIAGVKAAKQ